MDNNDTIAQYLAELKTTQRALEYRLTDISCNDTSIKIQTESLLKYINCEISKYEFFAAHSVN